MNRWEIEKSLSVETKENLINTWKEETEEYFENDDEQNDYINIHLENSIMEVIKELKRL